MRKFTSIWLEPNRLPLTTSQSCPGTPCRIDQVGFNTPTQVEGLPLITSVPLVVPFSKPKVEPGQGLAGGVTRKNGSGGSLTSIGSMVAVEELQGLEATIFRSKAFT